MIKLKLQHKLQLSVGLIILVVYGITTYLYVQTIRARYLESTGLYSSALAEDIKHNMFYLRQSNDNIPWIQQLQSIKCIQLYERHKSQGVVHFAVLNSSGEIVAHNRKELKGVKTSDLDLKESRKQITIRSGDIYRTLVPVITEESQNLGTIDIGVSASIVDRQVQQLMIKSVLLFFLFQIIANLAITLLVKALIIKPLKNLTQSSVIIAGGELDRDISINRSDEIGTLAESFINMRDSIKATILNLNNEIQEHNLAEEKILKMNEELEYRVEKRTKELSLVNRELLQAKEKAEAANNAKSDFLANMSHEIRTPMNAVLGFTQILSAKENDPLKKHYIENISASGNALLNLINDILDLSKIEAGKLELQYNAVSIHLLLQEMLTVFEHKVKDKGLNFIVDCDKSVPSSLILDEARLRQILINLISNAIKFTSHGHIQLSVHACEAVEQTKSQIDLLIEVEDTGVGIPDDQQEKIFDAFEQTKGQKTVQYGGTGLGLTICSRLAEMMCGSIEVNSEVGKGSTFSMTLHNVEKGAIKAGTEQNENRIDFSSVTFDPATILIVDDIDFNREMLSTYLQDWNFNIVLAENGKEAIKQARQFRPDLILLDMKMQVMDGYEASEKMKADEDLRNIPIIAVTASALKQDEEVLSRFCDGYLSKPVSKSDLVTELMKFLSSTKLVSHSEIARPVTEKPGHSFRILLAEDDLVNQRLVSAMLEAMNVDVITVNNGREAVELVQHNDFNLILMDMNMPEMNGLEATRSIRQLERRGIGSLQILALSGHRWEDIRKECLEAGMDGSIGKPIDYDKLLKVITDLKTGI